MAVVMRSGEGGDGGGGESWRVVEEYVTPIVGREVVVVGRRERRR